MLAWALVRQSPASSRLEGALRVSAEYVGVECLSERSITTYLIALHIDPTLGETLACSFAYFSKVVRLTQL